MRFGLILVFTVLFNISFFAQENEIRNGSCTFNVSSNFYFRQLGGAFTTLEVPTYKQRQTRYNGPYYSYTNKHRMDGLYVSAGAEFILNNKNSATFSYGFGLAYNYVKDRYSYSYTFHPYDYWISNTTSNYITKNGDGELMNHMLRFVFSLNWTTKKDLTFYIRPLNYEMRFIQNKCLGITREYYVIKSKIGIPSYGASHGLYYTYKDSIQTLTKEYEEPVDFVRHVSFCFPTTIGIEQKFHFSRTALNVGISLGASLLELYYVPRVYVGICFGNFKTN